MSIPQCLVTMKFFKRAVSPENTGMKDRRLFRVVKHIADLPGDTRDPEWKAEAFKVRFERGHEAIVLPAVDETAFLAWIATGILTVEEIGLQWSIAPSEFCIYDCLTAPRHRLQGHYRAALNWLTAQDFCIGRFNRAWIYADARNEASLRGIAAAGFSAAGALTAIRLRGRTLLRIGGIAGVNT